MRSVRTRVWCLVGCAGALGAVRLAAQTTSSDTLSRVADGTVAAPSGEWVRMRGSASATLRHTVSLLLHNATVSDALAELGRVSGLRIYYGVDVQHVRGQISLHVDNLTVAEALDDVLAGTGLEAFVATHGAAILIRRADGISELPVAQQPGTGTVTGHVTDGALKTPLSDVSVRVEGTALRTTASTAGKYTITGAAPGTYRITARRVGYQALTKDVTIVGDQAATLDFALAAAPTRLDEVVTTAVGEQRRYQVGNDISTINADSIAPTAPITSLTDLISARAPGVTVLETSGMTGSGEAIRIEGLTSLVLQNDPILIVDGVRQDNSAGGDLASYNIGGGIHPTPTRLNDIDFNDIETIDILKGPSASTEYGTDAANGVIVITTKHGDAGAPQWRLSAEQTTSDVPESFPNGYYSFGHLTNGSNTTVNCLLVPVYGGQYAQYGPPGNTGSTYGTCVVDSVARWNPLNHAATSLFTTGGRAKYDLSAGGGSEAVRYFVAGGLSNETGVIQMPPVFKELADTSNLGLPNAAFRPNSEQQRSVRVNTAIKLGPAADLTATGSYLSTYQQTPDAGYLYAGVFGAPALSGAAHYYGYGASSGSSSYYTPLSELSRVGSDNTDQVTGGLTANWRPTRWFVGHVTVGLDHGSQTNQGLGYPLANPAYQTTSPSLGLADVTTDVYSVDLRGTVTTPLTRGLRAATSAGLQMVDTRTAGQTAFVSNITATNLTLNGATGPYVTQLGTRQATLGGYGEEQLSVADRLYLTGALRVDAASGFGGAYSTAAYPKASVSWLAINQGATTVRVRGAFGESGVQPMNGAALQLYYAAVAAVGTGGAPVSGSQLTWPGNPHLQPERSAEFEGGVDVGGWGNRVSLAVTAYAKTTHDALVNVNLGETFNYMTYQENVGEVRNTGVEGSVTVGLVANRALTWNVALNASVNQNVLLAVAPGITAQTVSGYDAQFRQAVGYPLYGIWAQDVIYGDANHDGLIEPNEERLVDSATYQGPSMPAREMSVSTHVGLWRGALTLGGLVDYRGGYKVANIVAQSEDNSANTPGANAATAPLWLQAREGANWVAAYAVNALDVEDGSFVRVREISLTYALPHAVIRALRAQSLTLTGAIRNLALWTRYSGVDPEVSNTAGYNVQGGVGGANIVNNDVRGDYGAVPLARYWVVRLNLGL